MKRLLISLLLVLVITGCSKTKKEEVLGTWQTTYEMNVLGTITETYTFKENGICVKELKTKTDIVNDCTYEFNKEKNQIRIIWDNKLDKESFSKFEIINENSIMIGEHKYEKK